MSIISIKQEARPRYSLRSLLTFDSLNPHSCSIAAEHRSKVFEKTTTTTTAQIINYLGRDVLFSSIQDGGRFLTPEHLEPYRMIGDPPLDDLLEFMDREGCPLKPGDDLLLSSSCYPVHIQKRIDAFVERYSSTTLPSWVDTDQLQRGQRVFLRYGPAISVSLYYRSFVAGFSIPKIAAVIKSTAYLAPPSTPEQVAFRLVDTGALLGSCMRGLDNILPGAEGWKMCLHVRILHAKVRRTLLRRTGKRAWKTDEYGIPINQEDMAATLLAFSFNTLQGIEFVGGVDIPRNEQEDYIALWRYIGWLLGAHTDVDQQFSNELIPLDPCGPGWNESTPDAVDHASCLLQSIILHLLKPDQSSVTVSHHLLKIGRPQRKDDGELPSNEEISKAKASMDFWFHFRALSCRYFVGDPLANALELPFHPQFQTRIIIYCCVRLYLWVFRILTWVAFWEMLGRSRLERYCLGMLGKFHSVWMERHPSRMAKALKTDSPCCPFAMITSED